MIHYFAMRAARELASASYDICACEVTGDIIEILSIARDVTSNREEVPHLLALLNSADVDPIHMGDIIEDALAPYDMLCM